MNRNERSILIVTSLGHALCHWSALLITGIFEQVRSEFALSHFLVTVLPLTGYVLMGVGSLPAGLLTDRLGPKFVLLIYFSATALASVVAALSQNAWGFAFALTLLGGAVSLYHPTGLAMISRGFRKRGSAMGIHGISGSIGLSGGWIGLVCANQWGWRTGYWLMAMIGLAGFLVLALIPIRLDDVETPNAESPNPQSQKPQPARKPSARLLILLFAPMMLTGFNYRALMTALPTYLAGEPDGSATSVRSILVLLVFLAGGASQFLMGRYADRTHASKLYVKLVAMSAPIALLLAWTGGGTIFAIGAALALAVVHFGTQPVENLLIAEHTPASLRSMSYGIKFTLTFGIGALAAPAVGYLWDTTGTLAWTFVVFSVIALVIGAIILQLVKAVDGAKVDPNRSPKSAAASGTVNQDRET
ncbi:MAG: MFS transporter [Planctomycetes bacterium]|nr:MFS transporter [Planctomycetota bacterium]